MINPDLATVGELIRRHAQAEILPRFTHVSASAKPDGSLVTEADYALQQALAAELAGHWPEIPLLGEEMPEAEQRALLETAADGLWVLDPLDGTTNFAAGIPYFGVSLALLDAAGPRLGLIYDPIRDELFSAERGAGAWLNGTPLRTPQEDKPLRHCVAEIDFKRLPKTLAMRLASEHPYASQRNFGSSALDWCWLAASRFDLYLHGGQRLWDYAAAVLILREAGGTATTLQGDPIHTTALTPTSVVAAPSVERHRVWFSWLHGSDSLGG